MNIPFWVNLFRVVVVVVVVGYFEATNAIKGMFFRRKDFVGLHPPKENTKIDII